jgi:hypothetical protein
LLARSDLVDLIDEGVKGGQSLFPRGFSGAAFHPSRENDLRLGHEVEVPYDPPSAESIREGIEGEPCPPRDPVFARSGEENPAAPEFDMGHAPAGRDHPPDFKDVGKVGTKREPQDQGGWEVSRVQNAECLYEVGCQHPFSNHAQG